MSEVAGQTNDGQTTSTDEASVEIMVVVSKLKSYIRAKSGMNTAGTVAEKVTTLVQGMCDRAIEKATAAHRKTVMDRDFD